MKFNMTRKKFKAKYKHPKYDWGNWRAYMSMKFYGHAERLNPEAPKGDVIV